MTLSGYALLVLSAYTLLTLGGLTVSALRAVHRHLPAPPTPAQAWARDVQRAVRTDGEWTDGESVVWQDRSGWWHLGEEHGTLAVPPSEVQCELVGLFYRRASRAARDAAGGVA